MLTAYWLKTQIVRREVKDEKRERSPIVIHAREWFCVVCPILPLISGLYRNSIINVDLDHGDPERQNCHWNVSQQKHARIKLQDEGVCVCLRFWTISHWSHCNNYNPKRRMLQVPMKNRKLSYFCFHFLSFFFSLMEPSRVLSCFLPLWGVKLWLNASKPERDAKINHIFSSDRHCFKDAPFYCQDV